MLEIHTGQMGYRYVINEATSSYRRNMLDSVRIAAEQQCTLC